MLDEFVSALSSDLEMKDVPVVDAKTKSCIFDFAGFSIIIKALEKGVHFKAEICEAPQKKRENILIKVMTANLIGQGTGGAAIGIDKQEKFLTLSLPLAYEMNYQAFKENIEDFINYLHYWKDEVEKAQQEAEDTLL